MSTAANFSTSTWLHQPLISSPIGSSWLLLRPSKRHLRIKATNSDSSSGPPGASSGKNPLAAVLEVPKALWRQTLQPLGDFGFGQRSIWEGGIGLFIVSGAALFALAIVWMRGLLLRSRFSKYQAVFEFSQASGICVGTPVRIRGVTVGSVVRVNSSLKSIEAVAEVSMSLCACFRDFHPHNSSQLQLALWFFL